MKHCPSPRSHRVEYTTKSVTHTLTIWSSSELHIISARWLLSNATAVLLGDMGTYTWKACPELLHFVQLRLHQQSSTMSDLLHLIALCVAVTARLLDVTYYSVCVVIIILLMSCYHATLSILLWAHMSLLTIQRLSTLLLVCCRNVFWCEMAYFRYLQPFHPVILMTLWHILARQDIILDIIIALFICFSRSHATFSLPHYCILCVYGFNNNVNSTD